MKITKDTSIIELLQEHPEAQKILAEYDLGCARCLKAVIEDLESVAQANEIDIEELLEKLNQLETTKGD